MLSRYWPHKTDPVAQCVITETYIPVVLRLDEVISGHPGANTFSSPKKKLLADDARM